MHSSLRNPAKESEFYRLSCSLPLLCINPTPGELLKSYILMPGQTLEVSDLIGLGPELGVFFGFFFAPPVILMCSQALEPAVIHKP